jgi:hypothetical protein
MRLVMAAVLAMQVGCILKQGTMGTGSAGSGPDANGNVVIPDLFGMTREQAAEAVAQVGVAKELQEEPAMCGSVVNDQIVEIGQVCTQRPLAGTRQSARLAVAVTLQDEDPRHGGQGDQEWRLMPKLVGLTLDEARAAMRAAQFEGGARVKLYRVREAGCSPDKICRSSPGGMSRAYLSTNVYIYMGLDPSAPPPVAASEPEEPPPPPPPGQPELPPPPKDAVPEPFF